MYDYVEQVGFGLAKFATVKLVLDFLQDSGTAKFPTWTTFSVKKQNILCLNYLLGDFPTWRALVFASRRGSVRGSAW